MDDILMTSSLESFMQLISVLVIFVFVLVITYVTTRWMAGFQKSRSYNKNLKIIETIAVGNNKLISIVAVGKKYIAVSVGKDDVHFLTEIKEDELKDLSFLDEADMSADAIKTVDFPPVYGVDIVVSCEKAKDPKNGSIYLKPTQFVLGIGCRRDTAYENIDRAIRQSLLKMQIDISDIDMIASIDVKKDEPGIKEFCERNRIDFVTYTADELMAVQGEFSASQFVREHVGVDNVCERAAVLACSRECNEAGELIYKKHKYDRVTVAAAKYPD